MRVLERKKKKLCCLNINLLRLDKPCDNLNNVDDDIDNFNNADNNYFDDDDVDNSDNVDDEPQLGSFKKGGRSLFSVKRKDG